jgi:hypothetical protein
MYPFKASLLSEFRRSFTTDQCLPPYHAGELGFGFVPFETPFCIRRPTMPEFCLRAPLSSAGSEPQR